MRYYLQIFACVAAATLATILVINISVDPYTITGVHLPSDRNAIKPTFGDNHVLGKPFAAWRTQPTTVVFGTSRENHGINPDSTAWPAAAGTRYNLAMDAANIADIERLFVHITAVSHVKEVVLALDFLNMFDTNMHGAVNFDDSLLVSDTHSRLAVEVNTLRYLLSWPMLRDSIFTLRNQNPNLLEFELRGRRNALVFNGAAARLGQHHMFQFSETRYFKARINLSPAARYSLIDNNGQSTLLHLANILDRAAEHHINVRLFVTPVHARQLEVYRALGLWDALEDWKRQVSQIADATLWRKTSAKFVLWDFSGYTELTCEPIPAVGDLTTRMRWYWESSHYTEALGDMVLKRMYGSDDLTTPANFGVIVQRDNLDRHLQTIREDGARYRATHQQDMQDLASESAAVIASGIVLSM